MKFLPKSWRKKELILPTLVDIPTPPKDQTTSDGMYSYTRPRLDSSSSSISALAHCSRVDLSNDMSGQDNLGFPGRRISSDVKGAVDISGAPKTGDHHQLTHPTVSSPRYGAHGPPVNAIHGPPHNAVHGPPPHRIMHSPAPSPTRPSFTSPRRPPRPPNLNLFSSGNSPSPPQSPHPSATPTRVKFRLPGDKSPKQTPMRPKRSMPELNGVWKGFLEEVEENLDIAPSSNQGTQGWLDDIPDGVRDYYSPKHQVPQMPLRFSDLNASSPSLTSQLYPRTQYHSLPHSPPRHVIATQPTSSLLYDNSHAEPTTTQRKEGTAIISKVTLSMFPEPPPLRIRRKVAPTPLILQPTPSIAPLPPSPPSPAFSTPDTTPVATPTTSRSSQLANSHVARKPPSPVSILKRPTANLSGINATITPTTSPITASPNSPGSFQLPLTGETTVHPLRHTHSSSHVQSFASISAVAHRATSSDSTSDRSYSSQDLNDARRPRQLPSSPLRVQFPPKNGAHETYLKSKGRVPRPKDTSKNDIQWGYAV